MIVTFSPKQRQLAEAVTTTTQQEPVETEEVYKYLGTAFDNLLRFSSNTEEILKKCHQRHWFHSSTLQNRNHLLSVVKVIELPVRTLTALCDQQTVTGYIFFTNMYVSIFLLCCISCDRYVAIAYSVESRGVRRQRLAVLIALAIVLLVAVGHVPVFTMPEGNAQISGKRCFEPSQSSTTVTGFYYARVTIGFLLPLIVLVASNRGILASVQHSTGLRREQKQRVRWLATAVVVLFLVCFAPYHAVLLARAVMFHFPALRAGCLLERVMYTPYTVSLGLSTVNSAVNPILYVLSSDNIRKELRHGVAQLCTRAGSSQRSDSSQNKNQPTRVSSEVNGATDSQKPPGGESTAV
ncbi:probable G-protein coupled receptor 132 [Perca fluviatilis]|uniref:probable G-protein coupled receptor 132 n=1 Tax=Perca fluviatilis TaxID=8168 RepID=UPI0019638166|nr:probable G-protein coupled receptor 132 [Perca fluviatilis]